MSARPSPKRPASLRGNGGRGKAQGWGGTTPGAANQGWKRNQRSFGRGGGDQSWDAWRASAGDGGEGGRDLRALNEVMEMMQRLVPTSRGRHQPASAGVQLCGPHETQRPLECGSHAVRGCGRLEEAKSQRAREA